jgi:pyrroloquinoline quinone (PQQ) biosynthesis protein C
LLKHLFYQAWTARTLTVEDLQVYAREYGTLIETLPLGWLALNDPETAKEEIEHVEYWDVFTNDLGTKKVIPN